jgi:L-asparagine permease
MYFLNWTMAAIVDTTAIARYCHYWRALAATPQWALALGALLLALAVNLATVRWFGEIQFWTALVKVLALGGFLAFGVIFLVGGGNLAGQRTGFGVIARSGGLFPSAGLPVALAVSSTVFAYAAVEMVGTAA